MLDNNNDTRRNRHRDFWETAFAAFRATLFAYALTLTNGRSYEAEDLANETYCRVLTYPKDPEEVENPLSYLKTILRNIWHTEWKKAGASKTESLDALLSREGNQQRRSVEPAVEPNVLQKLENEELREAIRANQGPLTPREKELFELYLEGYDCEEIADKFGEDVRLVRSDLNAVRTKVRSRVMARASKTRP